MYFFKICLDHAYFGFIFEYRYWYLELELDTPTANDIVLWF